VGLELAKAYILIRAPAAQLKTDLLNIANYTNANIKSIGKIANGMFLAFGVGIDRLFKSMENVVAMGARQMEAELRMGAVMKATGEATGFTSKQLIAYASHIQRVTAIEDVRVMEAMAKMATFKNIQGETFRRAIMAATDIERMGFANLNRASIQLGRSLQDPLQGMEAMTRFGISLGKETRELIKVLAKENKLLEAQDIILSAVEAKMKGTAAFIGMTMMGDYRKLLAVYDDMREAIGMELLPLEIKMRQQQVGLVGSLRPLAALIGMVANNTGQWIPNIRLAIGLLTKLSIAVTGAAIAMRYFGFAMKDFTVANVLFFGAAGGIVTASVIALVAALAALVATGQKFWSLMKQQVAVQQTLSDSTFRLTSAYQGLVRLFEQLSTIKLPQLFGDLFANQLYMITNQLVLLAKGLALVAGSWMAFQKMLISTSWASMRGDLQGIIDAQAAYAADMAATFITVGRIGKVVNPRTARAAGLGGEGGAGALGSGFYGFESYGKRLQESLLKDKSSPEERTAQNTEMISKQMQQQIELAKDQKKTLAGVGTLQ